MSKIATIEVVVPEETKADDVFNLMRNKQLPMALRSLEPNPKDPPLMRCQIDIYVEYEARGAEDANNIEDAINLAVQSVKGVTTVHGR